MRNSWLLDQVLKNYWQTSIGGRIEMIDVVNLRTALAFIPQICWPCYRCGAKQLFFPLKEPDIGFCIARVLWSPFRPIFN